MIEPDSLPNLSTNAGDPRCGNVATTAAYTEGVRYAVTELASKTPSIIYVDGAHGGWLGWQNNAEDFAAMIAAMDIAPYIRGFATNVANYQPVGTTACPAEVAFSSDTIYKFCSLTEQQGGGAGHACCADACGMADEWNSAVTEINYVAILARAMETAIPGFEPKFVVDTGRNGVANMRDSCSNWCNIRGAGIGQLPTVDGLPDPRIDALYWLKTPGESDGCTELLPSGEACPRFDEMCGSADSLGSAAAEPRAPEAGHWFEYQILQLAANADLAGPGFADVVAEPVGEDADEPATGDGDESAANDGCAGLWEQCGGEGHAGPTCCSEGSCLVGNRWYSQCTP